jgi:PKD repeat protein
MPWNSWTETDFRTPGESLPSAGFVASPRGGPVPLTVAFTDESMGDITAWLWDFGDGVTSTLQSPSHTYTLTGTYAVSLTVSGPEGSDTEIKPAYITAGYPAPDADFTAAPLTGEAPLIVQFTDIATGAITRWDWVFGDGGVSGARYPEYEYMTPGTYTVSLTVSGPGGFDTETKVDCITVTPPVYLPPIAEINFVAPNPAVQGQDTIYFSGSGRDADERGDHITAYVWTSDMDGQLSTHREFIVQASALSMGAHTISFKVQDDEGEWSPEVTSTLTVEPSPAAVRTLILVNRQKLETLYGASQADQVTDALHDLALHDSVEGLVVQVESDPTVAAAYALWEADPTSTAGANDVAEAIKGVIDSHWNAYPDLEYLVIVGDDRVIPFYRALDGTSHPESHYGAISPASTVGAALQDDMTLTDSFYGDEIPVVLEAPGWHDHELYIPDLGIGRLIESPAEIVAQIDAFLANDGIVVDDAIVTGYPFVQDTAEVVCSELTEDGLTVDCSLVGSGWNGGQFEAAVLDTRHDVVSFNGHATHYIIDAPSGYVLSSDVDGATADHSRALFYTPGCHAGLNVPPTNPYQPLDIAQAMARNKSVYVANTGYGWGFVFSIGLSEQLMVDFTERLVYGQSTTVGQALTAAKQEYYLSDRCVDVYDEKILLQSTLYGLPMLRYTTPATLDARRETAAGDAVAIERETRVLDDGLTVNSLSYQFPVLLAEGSPEGQYYTLGGQVHSGDGQPLQPKYVASLSFPGTRVHGVVFTGGTYGDIASFNPVVDRAVTETVALEPAFNAAGWYPAVPHQLNHLGGDGRLVTLLGQYNAQGQTERLFERQSFDVYYHVDSADWTPPTILDVGSVLVGSEVVVSVAAADDAGTIHAVVIAYTSGDGVWASTSLVGSGSEWSGSFPAGVETVFFVQVVDRSGNVAVNDNHGLYFSPGDGASVQYLPILSVRP